jgi:hypothetical protein
MILTAILGLIQSLLYYTVLFFLGKILSHPEQLRSFLGLNSQDEQAKTPNLTSNLIGKLGRLVMIIAIISMLTSIVTTALIFVRM